MTDLGLASGGGVLERRTQSAVKRLREPVPLRQPAFILSDDAALPNHHTRTVYILPRSERKGNVGNVGCAGCARPSQLPVSSRLAATHKSLHRKSFTVTLPAATIRDAPNTTVAESSERGFNWAK